MRNDLCTAQVVDTLSNTALFEWVLDTTVLIELHSANAKLRFVMFQVKTAYHKGHSRSDADLSFQTTALVKLRITRSVSHFLCGGESCFTMRVKEPSRRHHTSSSIHPWFLAFVVERSVYWVLVGSAQQQHSVPKPLDGKCSFTIPTFRME